MPCLWRCSCYCSIQPLQATSCVAHFAGISDHDLLFSSDRKAGAEDVGGKGTAPAPRADPFVAPPPAQQSAVAAAVAAHHGGERPSAPARPAAAPPPLPPGRVATGADHMSPPTSSATQGPLPSSPRLTVPSLFAFLPCCRPPCILPDVAGYYCGFAADRADHSILTEVAQ